jgi:phage baseplate assembly protein gpV
MISKTWSRKPVAALVAVAILSVYSMVVLASPAAKAPSAELSIAGQVTVNGETAVSGGTVFSDSLITTAEKSNATVNLSKLGRVELSPTTNMKLSFTDKTIGGLLDNGTARISTLAGSSVNITTKDGSVTVDGSQPTSFTINVLKGVTYVTTHSGVATLNYAGTTRTVAAGESASAGMPDAKTDPGDDDDKLSRGELAALLLLGAGATAGILYAAMHNNDLNFAGNAIVISPAK